MSTITAAAPRGLRRLWERQLPHYPDTARRMSYLAITVLATITLYYELYVQGAVAPKIIEQYHFSFTGFVVVAVAGAAFGAFASLAAGLADRWGRADRPPPTRPRYHLKNARRYYLTCVKAHERPYWRLD